MYFEIFVLKSYSDQLHYYLMCNLKVLANFYVYILLLIITNIIEVCERNT